MAEGVGLKRHDFEIVTLPRDVISQEISGSGLSGWLNELEGAEELWEVEIWFVVINGRPG